MPIILMKTTLFYLGCLCCYTLQVEFGIHAVMAATTVALIGSFINFPKKYRSRNFPAVIYSGTFAGMCSPAILRGHSDVIVLSLIGTVLYLLALPYAKNFGGKLGTVAFVSSVIFVVLRKFV